MCGVIKKLVIIKGVAKDKRLRSSRLKGRFTGLLFFSITEIGLKANNLVLYEVYSYYVHLAIEHQIGEPNIIIDLIIWLVIAKLVKHKIFL